MQIIMLYLLLRLNDILRKIRRINELVYKPFIPIFHKIKVYSDYIYLRNCGVVTEPGFVTLIGKPIIQKHVNSIIKIDKGVTLISKNSGNPAGISHPVILATLNENAIIHIGKDSGISGSTICSATNITIGEYVGIGVNSSIYDTDFHPLNPMERKFDNINKTINEPVSIGDFAWIGGHSIILKGVSIGNGAVVGAGSVVTKNIPKLALYAGNPAKFVKEINIDDETYNNLFNTSSK